MATYTSERYVETQLNESVLLGISAVISVIYTVIKLIARLLIPPMDRSDIEKEGKVLFVVEDFDSFLYKACRNMKSSIISTPIELEMASVLDAKKIIFAEKAFSKMKEIMESWKKLY